MIYPSGRWPSGNITNKFLTAGVYLTYTPLGHGLYITYSHCYDQYCPAVYMHIILLFSETEGCDAGSSMAVASSFSSFSFSGGQPLGEIKEETLPISPHQVQVLDYNDKSQVKYSVDDSLKRARTRLGEKKYNVVTNNCEHLVNWAKTGVAQSSQSQAGVYHSMGHPLLPFICLCLHRLLTNFCPPLATF